MELVIFGASIMLVIVVWHYMIMRTVVDATRDKLFDLRDEIRQTFKDNQWDMGSETYKSLRDLMNGYLRFTEQYSFWRFVYLEVSVITDKQLAHAIGEHTQKRFVTVPFEQRDFVKSMRDKAVHVVLEYSVYSSGLLLAMSLIVSPFVLVGNVITVVNRGLGAILEVFTHLGRNFTLLFKASTAMIYKKVFRADFFESYSSRLGTT